MASLYLPFLERLSPGFRIVDAGCGSGRDALFFAKNNFDVIAFDASEKLVKLARQETQLDIQQCSFLDFQTDVDSVQGIWACASLLHVPFDFLPDVFTHLVQFLVTDGIFYCSFKYGTEKLEHEDRLFTNLNEKLLADVITGTGLWIDRTWQTDDLRPERAGEFWLNALLLKT